MTATVETPAETLTFETINFTITNTCLCAYCDDCEVGMVVEYGESCVECGSDEHMHYDSCREACIDDMDIMKSWIGEWKSKHRNKYVLATCVENHPLFGHKRTGYKIMEMTDDLSASIAPDTNWSQKWSMEVKRGGSLTCVQSHHDHPTGQHITFEPIAGKDKKMLDSRGYIVREDMEIYL